MSSDDGWAERCAWMDLDPLNIALHRYEVAFGHEVARMAFPLAAALAPQEKRRIIDSINAALRARRPQPVWHAHHAARIAYLKKGVLKLGRKTVRLAPETLQHHALQLQALLRRMSETDRQDLPDFIRAWGCERP
ncbi:MAG: hypothetical protein M0T84_09510 [Betaproteobacteria bacterium]|nr:hypothetical protein [Betaproteobacteria bacterium]